jgi:FtsP/CotA-like multicopper oxidase with cupredoxin domain
VLNIHNQPHNFHVHGVAFQIVPLGGKRPPIRNWDGRTTVLLAAGESGATGHPRFPPYQDCLTPYMWRVPVNARTASTRL